MKRCCSLPLTLVAVLLAGTWPGAAATITWTNTSGGNWSAAGNWSPHDVPGPADTVLIIQAGTYTVKLDTSATITSLTLGAASGQQRLTNHANTLTINGAATNGGNGVLDLAGGSLAGPGVWQVNANGVFNWSGGSLAKALTVASDAVLNLSGTMTKAAFQPLTNWGTINWAGGDLTLLNDGSSRAGAIYNQPGALFDLQCDLSLSSTYGFEFILNAGTFRKSAAAGRTSIFPRLDNSGTVEAQNGTLQLNGGGMLGGTFSAQTEAAVKFAAGDFVLSGTLAKSGGGVVAFTSGNITFTGPITSFDLTAGTLTGTNELAGTLNWSGGQVQGALTVAEGALLNWSSGSLSGPLTVASNAVLNLLDGIGPKLVSQAVTNWGTINWAGDDLTLRNDGSSSDAGAIYNQPGALFDVQCDQRLANYFGSEFIVNAGIFRKSAGTGSAGINVGFDNTGTVQVEKGAVHFSGSYTSAPTSNLRFIFSGMTAGTGFGQVRFGTALVPAGVVSGEVVSGFSPPTDTRFQVISGGLAGDLFNVDRDAGNGYVFDFFRAGDTFTLVTRPGHLTLPPLLSLLKVRPGIWSFLMEGQPGLTYRIQSASELRETPPTEWVTIGTNTTPSGLVQFLVTNTATQQFYRAVTP